jgi:uncharacterized protein (TIGR02466 family)
MNLDYYFPTPVWWEQTEIDNLPIEALAYRLRKEDPVGRKLSNQGGWQSMDFRPGTHSEVAELEKRIMDQAANCYRDYGYKENCCIIVMENMWININEKGCTNSVHIHDNSFISGAYYVKAKRGHGNLNFYKSYYQDYIISSQAAVDKYTPISASAITFEPSSGKLIMFPGFLPHGVERNELDEDRISISFNIKLIRIDDERYWPTASQRN